MYFRHSAVAVGRGTFGPGTGPVWLSGVSCLGSEQQLLSCPITSPLDASKLCTHANDAGVICGNFLNGELYKLNYWFIK